jgi:hypothetical protein
MFRPGLRQEEIAPAGQFLFSSFLRKQESSHFSRFWTRAFAGVTSLGPSTRPPYISLSMLVCYVPDLSKVNTPNNDKVAKSRKNLMTVIPAEAGIQ